MSKAYPKALAHTDIEEVLPEIFFVTGTMPAAPLIRFGRNMIIVRQGQSLTLINTVRLRDAGLKQLDALGKVEHVIKLGYYHDRDDSFYVDRYQANFWAMPGHQHNLGLEPDVEMDAATELPFDGASLFVFESTTKPEAVVHLAREGGVLLCCDALQNWAEPGFGMSFLGKRVMRKMGFFKRANVGPMWRKVMKPRAEDFIRLEKLPYKHALGAHGAPCIDTAHEDYHTTFERIFGI